MTTKCRLGKVSEQKKLTDPTRTASLRLCNFRILKEKDKLLLGFIQQVSFFAAAASSDLAASRPRI